MVAESLRAGSDTGALGVGVIIVWGAGWALTSPPVTLRGTVCRLECRSLWEDLEGLLKPLNTLRAAPATVDVSEGVLVPLASGSRIPYVRSNTSFCSENRHSCADGGKRLGTHIPSRHAGCISIRA